MNMEPQRAIYEIRIQGHLDARRARQFDDLSVAQLPEGVTTLTGALPDQAALYGLLSRLRDLGVVLISVQRFNAPDEREEYSHEDH